MTTRCQRRGYPRAVPPPPVGMAEGGPVGNGMGWPWEWQWVPQERQRAGPYKWQYHLPWLWLCPSETTGMVGTKGSYWIGEVLEMYGIH